MISPLKFHGAVRSPRGTSKSIFLHLKAIGMEIHFFLEQTLQIMCCAYFLLSLVVLNHCFFF